jgi:hypothetical protein
VVTEVKAGIGPGVAGVSRAIQAERNGLVATEGTMKANSPAIGVGTPRLPK